MPATQSPFTRIVLVEHAIAVDVVVFQIMTTITVVIHPRRDGGCADDAHHFRRLASINGIVNTVGINVFVFDIVFATITVVIRGGVGHPAQRAVIATVCMVDDAVVVKIDVLKFIVAPIAVQVHPS